MLNRDEGGLFLVLRFPHPWPPPKKGNVLHVNRETTSLKLSAECDGSLLFTIGDSRHQIQHRTQPIEIAGPGWAILGVRWNSGTAEIYINSEPILSFEAAKGRPKFIRTSEHPPSIEPAWEDPTAESSCAKWVDWRAKKFLRSGRTSKRGRRLKTRREQVDELIRAKQILADFGLFIQQGRTHLLGHLAAELRALLYWNGRNYDPLLLRVAAMTNSPLPIYIIPEKGPVPLGDQLSGHIRRGEPSITKTRPSHRVADIQEWLESEVLRERSSDSGQWLILDAKGVISGVAATMGAAHYDPDVPTTIEMLGTIRGPLVDEITMTLLVCASLVISLCDFVIGRVDGAPPNTR